MSIGQEVEMLRQEIANGPPLFPPPNGNAEELSEQFKRKKIHAKKPVTSRMLLCYFIKNQTQQTYRKYAIEKVAGELWNTTNWHNRAAFQTLCLQINSIILIN